MLDDTHGWFEQPRQPNTPKPPMRKQTARSWEDVFLKIGTLLTAYAMFAPLWHSERATGFCLIAACTFIMPVFFARVLQKNERRP